MKSAKPVKTLLPRRLTALAVAASAAMFSVARVRAADPAPAAAPAASTPAAHDAIKQANAAVDKALAWLKTQQDPKDHTWGSAAQAPGLTGLVLKAYVQQGADPRADFLEQGFNALVKYQKETGGIYTNTLASYNTAIAISALASAPNQAELKEPLKKAVDYLKGLQWSDTINGLPNNEQPVNPSDPRFGGWGYGGGKTGRPDGSNLQLALDALHDAGIKPEDPSYQNALKFVTRMQNLSETNDQAAWVGGDGGFIYTPANQGQSQAGEYKDDAGRTLKRSYGSMTYAGLKSMIYAGLTKNDPRVKAAWAWIGKNWTLDENPGMKENDPKTAQNGLYYYYHTMARALRAYGEPVVTDASGKPHDWRLELVAKLAAAQAGDGHWAGKDKWMEGNPVLVTGYATLALQEAVADLKERPAK